MMQEIKKEIRYGFRTYRFLILFVGFLFFAILDPVMTKFILPAILNSQMPGVPPDVLSGMFDATQVGVMRTYMGDVFEIVSLIVVFTLCGLMAQDIKDNTLVLPICSGKRFGQIVGGKMLVFAAALVLAPVLAVAVNYVYAGVLFSFDIAWGPVIRAGLLQGAYMAFLLVLIILWGTWIKKPVAAGFAALATSLGLYFLGNALGISAYLPSGLLAQAALFAVVPSSMALRTLCITAGIVSLLLALTLWRLHRMEWNER